MERWDDTEREIDLLQSKNDLTALEVIIILKKYIARSTKYTPETKAGLLKAAQRDLEKILGA